MKTHKLKCWPEFFQAIKRGEKRFELRKNDRDFKVGDTLLLQEYDVAYEVYSGQELSVIVTYILDGNQWDIADMVIMSIEFPCVAICPESSQPELKAVKTAEEILIKHQHSTLCDSDGKPAHRRVDVLKAMIEYANQFSQPKEEKVDPLTRLTIIDFFYNWLNENNRETIKRENIHEVANQLFEKLTEKQKP